MLLATLIFTPLIAAILIAPFKRTSLWVIEAIAIVASLVQLITAVRVIPIVLAQGSIPATSFLSLDALGALVALIIAIVSLFVTLYSLAYLRGEMKKEVIGFRRIRQYFVLSNVFVFAMFFAVAAVNPIMMWIAIEATTLSTAFLISFYHKPSATEAAWKYLILNSFGLLTGLLGTLLFLSLATGEASTWQTFAASLAGADPLALKIAFIFIFIGYGTKVGLVPMHTWKPDAYGKAPTSLAALLAGVLINVAFLAIIRFKIVVDGAIGSDFTSMLLMYFGVVSILVASLIVFVQQRYKRLLAYSSIEHAGIMAAGFAFGGIGVFASLLHMFYHALIKSLMFLLSGNIFLAYSSTKLRDVSGMFTALPVTSVLFFISFLGATGVPPFGTFATELTILAAGMADHPYITSLMLIGILIAFLGFFKHIYTMSFGDVPPQMQREEKNTLLVWVPMILFAVVLCVSIYIPAPLSELIAAAAYQITN